MEIEDFFYNLTHLNISILRNGSEHPEFHAEGPFTARTLEKLDFAALLNTEAADKPVRHVVERSGLHFLQASKSGSNYIIGPFILEDEKSIRISGQFSLRNRMPVLSTEQTEAYFSAIILYIRHGAADIELPGAEAAPAGKLVMDQVNDLDDSEIELKYRIEGEFRDMIARGDTDALKRAIETYSIQDDFNYRVPGNPLRAQKNIAIVGNTIGRHAAEKGGLPPYMLHMLSEEYAIKIERCRSIEELSSLNITIMHGYCAAVRNYGIKTRSAAVMKTEKYILRHLSRKHHLRDLAAVAGCSPNYLSAVFKKETGQTISAYIRRKRIIEARWMLGRSSESVTGIALHLGYDDPNYFSRCFSSETGMPPADYRRNRAADDISGLP